VPILRINQLDAKSARQTACPDAIGAQWPADIAAFELRILPGEDDSESVTLDELTIDTATALRIEGQVPVLRLDGAFEHLAPAFPLVRECALGISPVRQFDVNDPPASASLRVGNCISVIRGIFDVLEGGIGPNVKMRLLSLPSELVGPFLDMDDTDDERWPEILAGAGFGIELLPQSPGLLVFTPLAADDLTAALTMRLAP
jgi:hypothetical protein